MKLLNQMKNIWRRWRSWSLQWPVLIGIVIIVAIVLAIAFGRGGNPEAENLNERAPVAVTTTQLSRLTQGATIEVSGQIESASFAPLVARTGGRVTKVQAHLGDTVVAGSTIVQIDGQGAANPSRAQVAGAQKSLTLFDDIQANALTAANNAIVISETNLKAAVSEEKLSQEQAAVSRRLADNSVEGARLALEDARHNGTDALIRSADLAKKAADLAQDQATVGKAQAQSATATAVDVARVSLKNTRDAKTRLVADLASQRSQLTTQLNVAAESVRLQQVLAPVNGSITRLSVKPGDFVSPGQIIGEVDALAGAEVTIDVSTGIRNQLAVGDTITMRTQAQTFTATIARLAEAPSNITGKWQAEFFITSTPEVIHPNETVAILLPVGKAFTNSFFIPFDATTVRQNGVVIFTLQDGVAHEHIVDVVNFEGSFVEAIVDLAPETEIIISGNRVLRHGDTVRANPTT